MQFVQGVFDQTLAFINRDDFFYYHGLVLGLLWMFGIIIGILLRKTSKLLHGLTFIIIDYVTLFFLVGAIIRAIPHLEHFFQWSLIKQGHIVGGCVFLVALIIQHIGGATTLLKGISFNPSHRQFAVVVTNMGRILVVFGLIIAQKDTNVIIGASIIAIVLFAATVFKSSNKPIAPSSPSKQTDRQRSPPRDAKRD